MKVPVVIYDTALPQFQANRVFDRQLAAKFPGASAWVYFGEAAKQRGWAVMTSDVFLHTRPASAVALCVSDMITPYTRPLLATGVLPGVILSGESPNVAWNFYHNLAQYARPYRHAFLFGGVQSRIQPPTQFHPLYWPNACRTVLAGGAWEQREYLVLVASNKQRFAVSAHKRMPDAWRLAKRLVWYALQRTDPLFRFEDLYKERLAAILFFSNRPGFRLFGTGWEKPGGLAPKYVAAAKRAGAVAVDDKLATMANFKFALCFENCSFPGYVTEKIFDCFFAGCIPVYWGAPDISAFVPTETFVDARQFTNWLDLDRYLRELPASATQRHLAAARDFLASAAFDKFYQETFADELIAIIESEFVN